MQMYNSEGDLPYPIDAKVLGYVPKYTISIIKTIKTSDLRIYNVTTKTLVWLKRTISLLEYYDFVSIIKAVKIIGWFTYHSDNDRWRPFCRYSQEKIANHTKHSDHDCKDPS